MQEEDAEGDDAKAEHRAEHEAPRRANAVGDCASSHAEEGGREQRRDEETADIDGRVRARAGHDEQGGEEHVLGYLSEELRAEIERPGVSSGTERSGQHDERYLDVVNGGKRA